MEVNINDMTDTNSPANRHFTGHEQGRAIRQEGRTAVREADETKCQVSLLQSILLPLISISAYCHCKLQNTISREQT